MALYLVQHGKSLPKDVDPDQGLSDEGISETRRIAEVAAGYNIRVTGIKHSGKTRARQTAEIFAAALKPPRGVEQVSGLKPLDDVAVFAAALNPQADIMLVGHLPFMERMTAYLIVADPEKLIFKFQNSGIVCLDKLPDSDSWFLKWTLMPKIG